AADRERARDLVPPPAHRPHDEHLHRQWTRALRGPDPRPEARGVRLRRVRRPDHAREFLVHRGLRAHDPRRPGGGARQGRRARGEPVPDARPHRPYRRRLSLESNGRRLREGRAVPPPRHRRGSARAHRGSPDRGRRALARMIAELREIALAFPAPAKLPRVATHGARAADASLARLIEIGSFLLERLAREGCQVNVAIEREVADTRVANTAGAQGSYRTTGVAVSADVWRIAGDDVLAIGDTIESTDLPSEDALAGVVRSITSRLDHALRIVAPSEGALPVVFTPAGLSAVLLTAAQGLSGMAVRQRSSTT